MLEPEPYLLVMLGIFAGCATPPNKDHGPTVANSTGSDVQCHVAYITGTFMKKNVCSTQADRDAEQRSDDDLEDRVAQQPQTTLKGGGNGH